MILPNLVSQIFLCPISAIFRGMYVASTCTLDLIFNEEIEEKWHLLLGGKFALENNKIISEMLALVGFCLVFLLGLR